MKTIKKVLVLILLVIGLGIMCSCEKEEITPSGNLEKIECLFIISSNVDGVYLCTIKETDKYSPILLSKGDTIYANEKIKINFTGQPGNFLRIFCWDRNNEFNNQNNFRTITINLDYCYEDGIITKNYILINPKEIIELYL